MNNEMKPSLAAGMARRAFWIAVTGGGLGAICRVPALGQPAQALLTLLAIALFLIAAVIGAVALIRITAADRQAVLMPALGGFLLALAFLANLTYWHRDHWVRARVRRAVMENVTTSEPLRGETSRSKSIVPYALPALDDIAEVTARFRAQADRSQGDDAAVFRAWAAHLGSIYAAYTNTWAASNKLHAVDLLDPKLISDFNQDEPVRRRGLANQYSDAWHALAERLSTITGAFHASLREQRVSTERAGVESEALFASAQQSEMATRLVALQKLCKSGKDVGRHYNYAVSAVFEYALIASKVSNPSPSFRAKMDSQVAKLREVEQTAAAILRETLDSASAPAGAKSN